MKIHLRRRNQSRGMAMVEMAIVMPLLLLLLFAIAEFGLAFIHWQAVSQSAREGARAASLFRPACTLTAESAMEEAVDNVLSAANLTADSRTLTGACVVPGSSTVTVNVLYTFNFVPALASNFSLGTINLSATSVMANDPSNGG